ncbi:MAG: hypothetical protein KDD34_04645 [Bdellovibrionales bacterium]|nr:hypothetical protein [Bdellovibrionales bacterium]
MAKKKAAKKQTKKVAAKPSKKAPAKKATQVKAKKTTTKAAVPAPAEKKKKATRVAMASEVVKKAKKVKKSKKQIAVEEELDQLGKKWAALLRKSQKMSIKPLPYNMRKTFDARTPIQHKVLGWGYILANKNDRLEVLFKDGIKFLISNYKG